ncbi:MAG: hypothetical protein FWE97_02775 [Dehalococcoidia bacterium]|nr:hypothetical protein [Dehalococcoidia bacterium]
MGAKFTYAAIMTVAEVAILILLHLAASNFILFIIIAMFQKHIKDGLFMGTVIMRHSLMLRSNGYASAPIESHISRLTLARY